MQFRLTNNRDRINGSQKAHGESLRPGARGSNKPSKKRSSRPGCLTNLNAILTNISRTTFVCKTSRGEDFSAVSKLVESQDATV